MHASTSAPLRQRATVCRAVGGGVRAAMALWLLAIGIGACACRPATTLDIARVAVIVPLSGDGAAQGLEVMDGARLAVEEWNAAGGVHGLQLELLVHDEAAPDTARRLLADPRVVLGVGHLGPRAVESARAVLTRPDAPALITLATPAADAPLPEGMIALAPTVERVARTAAAAVAYNYGPTTVAVVASGTPEDTAAARAFIRAAPERGLQVRAELTLAGADGSYARAAESLRLFAPAVVYVAGRGVDAGALWAELRPRDSRARLVLGPGAFDLGFTRTAGGFFEGVLALSLTVRPEDSPAAEEFVRRFAARYGRPPSPMAARAYDATTLGLRAIASVAGEGTPARQTVRAALTREQELPGVLGTYVLRDGAPATWRLAIYRLERDGAAKLIGEPELP